MGVQDSRKLKICLVGDVGVGKTSLVRRYVLDQFSDKYIATIGTKVTKKTAVVRNPNNGKEEGVSLMIWDIMGQPSFREVLREAYFYGAQGALCVCDLTNRDTLNELKYWIKAMSATAGTVPLVIIGNKGDLKQEHEVTMSEMESFAKGINSISIVTSARTGDNVEFAFNTLIGRILQGMPDDGAL